MNIVSWSGGKDSTATVILAHELGINIDKIIMSEVMFDNSRGISNELPEHMEFVCKTAQPLFREWGYKTEILHDKQDYLGLFYRKKTKGKYKGKISGFPLGGKCVLNSYCKMRPIRQFRKNNNIEIEYVGICIDEPKRLARLSGNSKSLLAENNMTQQDAYNLCAKYELLSPVYKHGKKSRSGCWNCPNQSYESYADLKMYYPDKWALIKKLSTTENLTSQCFKWGETFESIERIVDNLIFHREHQISFEDLAERQEVE